MPRNYLQELSEYLTQPYQDRRPEPVERQPDGLMDRPHLVGKPWYYGSITRNQCDTLLNQHGHDGDFLIRDSETNVRYLINHLFRSNIRVEQLKRRYFNSRIKLRKTVLISEEIKLFDAIV